MSPTRRFACAAILASWCAGASAMTGNELLVSCEETSAVSQMECLTYIQGATEGMLEQWRSVVVPAFQVGIRKPPYGVRDEFIIRPPFCTADAVTLGQTKNVVLKYMRDNPAETHQRAAKLVLAAMIRSFPCRSRSSQTSP